MVADVRRIKVDLYGSLSATGVGHGTDNSVVIGLMGERPHSVDPEIIMPEVATLKENNSLKLLGQYPIEFIWSRDMNLLEENLPYHPNAMRLTAYSGKGEELYANTADSFPKGRM